MHKARPVTQLASAVPKAAVETPKLRTVHPGRVPHREEPNEPLRCASKREEEIDFAELADGSLVDLVEDPDNPARTLLALSKQGTITYHERLDYADQVFMPIPRREALLRHIRLPRGVAPYEHKRKLLVDLMSFIQQCVELKEMHAFVLAQFVLCTWIVDRLPVAPYVALVGPPQSGKTTLLKALSLVCRRPLLTADISSAAFYTTCQRLNPTLLIDEAGTPGDQRRLRHLLRMGTTRDVLTIRKDQVFHAFGAKVICWLEPPDDPALNSRCILIPMREANNPKLLKTTDATLEAPAATLQSQLLQLRLTEYRAIQMPELPDTERLRPRTRDLLRCLAAPFADDVEVCGSLIEFFHYENIYRREPLPFPQGAVLAALFSAIHQSAYGGELVKDLTSRVNTILKQSGEPLRVQPRRVGAVLTALGFLNRGRTSSGWTVLLDRADRECIHRLVTNHGIDYPLPEGEQGLCPLCQGAPPKS